MERGETIILPNVLEVAGGQPPYTYRSMIDEGLGVTIERVNDHDLRITVGNDMAADYHSRHGVAQWVFWIGDQTDARTRVVNGAVCVAG